MSCWKSSVRATKSDSQSTSTRITALIGRRAMVPDQPLAVGAPGLLRGGSPAPSSGGLCGVLELPAASSSAALHSIMPAPVWSRSF